MALFITDQAITEAGHAIIIDRFIFLFTVAIAMADGILATTHRAIGDAAWFISVRLTKLVCSIHMPTLLRLTTTATHITAL